MKFGIEWDFNRSSILKMKMNMLPQMATADEPTLIDCLLGRWQRGRVRENRIQWRVLLPLTSKNC